jgi:lipopolysaccharide assembly outer membrane protein LptD (OstA)
MVEVPATVKQAARYCLLFLGLSLCISRSAGQDTAARAGGRQDTVAPRPDTALARRDSSAVPDTLKPASSPSGVDTVVNYAASDSVVYALDSRTMFMYGKGDIRYRDMGLKAENIDINWNTAILNAKGVPDRSDSTGKDFIGLPEMKDGGETYHGSTVFYNFKTKKGMIDIGKTEIERGWYYGDSIKKVADKVLFVKDGRYTTCDLDHPHYYFYSPEMKIIIGHIVVARPVVLEIADVPVFALPFGIFPTERGRRSGLIAPAYGESATRGRYITHLGYYWAISDYMDWDLRADGYAKGGYTLYSDYRYALRYNFSGTLSGSYGRTILGERGDPGYSNSSVFNLRWSHDQAFNPTTRLLVDFTFTSGSYYQATSNNLNDLLRQNVVSNATLTKYWEGTPNSMTVNLHRDQNLSSGEISEVLPGISFNRSQSFPFRSSSASAYGAQKWYDLIGYTYGGQFQNVRNKTFNSFDSTFLYDQRWGVNHAVTINASPKAGYFTITPFFDFTSKWYNRTTVKYINAADSLVSTEKTRFSTVEYFDMGVSLSTKLYGIVRPNIFGITGIRHQVTPSISYVYQPDFSKPAWGYYGRYTDTTGAEQTYSRYEKGIFGGAPNEERQALAFRLGNIFEMKTAGDSVGQENKFQLLNLDLSTSYNFARDSLRFDPITASFRTSIGQIFTIGGSGTFNLYKFVVDPANPLAGRRVNKFLLSEGKIADLTNFSISIGTRLSGEKKKTTAGPIRTAADSASEVTQKNFIGLYDQETPDFSIPWSLDLNWNFSQSQPDPRYVFRSSALSAALSFNLTEFWKISVSANYDLVARQFAAPQITVYRDLHCWEMNFSWVPTGYYRNFQLTIRLKAPQLQDIKLTKQGSARGVY